MTTPFDMEEKKIKNEFKNVFKETCTYSLKIEHEKSIGVATCLWKIRGRTKMSRVEWKKQGRVGNASFWRIKQSLKHPWLQKENQENCIWD